MNYVEIVGYIASVLVAISLMMSQILKLRILNFIGAVTFSLYGFLVGAYPVFAVNGFIACINIYYLIKLYRNKDSFDILNTSDDSEYLERFYEHYQSDIKQFFNSFDVSQLKSKKSIFILRNMRPVNLVIYHQQDNGIIEIILDYTIPEYRDFLNGKYLLSIFKKNNLDVQQLVTKSESKLHIKYLSKLGFRKNDAGLFVKRI